MSWTHFFLHILASTSCDSSFSFFTCLTGGRSYCFTLNFWTNSEFRHLFTISWQKIFSFLFCLFKLFVHSYIGLIFKSFWHIMNINTLSSYLVYLFFLSFFWPCCTAYRILVPWPETETRAVAVKAPSSNHWTDRQFLIYSFLRIILSNYKNTKSYWDPNWNYVKYVHEFWEN